MFGFGWVQERLALVSAARFAGMWDGVDRVHMDGADALVDKEAEEEVSEPALSFNFTVNQPCCPACGADMPLMPQTTTTVVCEGCNRHILIDVRLKYDPLERLQHLFGEGSPAASLAPVVSASQRAAVVGESRGGVVPPTSTPGRAPLQQRAIRAIGEALVDHGCTDTDDGHQCACGRVFWLDTDWLDHIGDHIAHTLVQPK